MFFASIVSILYALLIYLLVNLEQKLVNSVLGKIEFFNESLYPKSEIVTLINIKILVPLKVYFYSECAKESPRRCPDLLLLIIRISKL